MKIWEGDSELSAESIDQVAEASWLQYSEQMGKRAVSKKEYLFSVVEYYEHFLETYGDHCKIHWKIYKFLNIIHYDCIVDGPKANPIGEKPDETWYSRVYDRNFGEVSEYYYDERRQQNHVLFEAPKKPQKISMFAQILIAFALALAVFFLLKLFPETVKTIVVDNIATPVFTKITTMITGVATPLVFLSVVGGIIGVGSSTTVSKIGSKFVAGMMFCYGFAAIAFSVIAGLLYGISSVTVAGETGVIGELVTLVLDMMPDNLFACFVNDNALQVIVLAVFVGFVLLLLGDKAKKISGAVENLEVLVNKMMALLCKLLLVVVFFGVMNILFMDITEMTSLYKVVVAFVICVAVIEAFMMIRVRVTTGASPLKLFKVQLPTTLMNLATSSQVGTMPENLRCLREDVGVDEKMLNFTLPLGIVTYMPNGAAFLAFLAFGMAEISGIPVDFLALVKIAVIAVVVAIAAPPIPGSAFAVMPIFFSACGIPMTYYPMAIVLGSVLGYFTPVLNGYALQLETIITAYKLKQIDPERFEKFKAQSKKSI